jgi:hypothetical protein
MSIFISTLDTLQSYYLQTLAVNPYEEANLLPFGFFHYGFLGYIAYIPIESIVNFALLFSVWIFACIILGQKKHNHGLEYCAKCHSGSYP